jgi:hypothetical protein
MMVRRAHAVCLDEKERERERERKVQTGGVLDRDVCVHSFAEGAQSYSLSMAVTIVRLGRNERSEYSIA